jgi:diguanylate cyclase (GGDEF)-like protein/PAS domain S-box-containing protein
MPTQAYQVLLVSQNELTEKLLAAPSGAAGDCEFAVTRACCVEEAAARLGAGDTETRAIVLDAAAADSAADTCRHLKSLGSDLPVVLLTDAADASQRETLLAAGVDAVLGPDEADNGGLSEALAAALQERDAAAVEPARQALLAAALESLGEGVLVADRQERLLLANPAAKQLLGIESLGALPTDVLGVYETDTITRIRHREHPMTRAIRGDEVTDLELYHRPSGASRGRFLSVNARPLVDAAGAIAGGVVTFRDVTDRRKVEDELTHLSLHDALTGLPNRAFFLENLDKAVARARRAHSRLAVLLLDLDRFKQTNDRLGHESGDQLLIEVARRLGTSLRAGDFVGRLGGDEFVILFEDFGHDEHAASLATKIVDVLSPPIRLQGYDVAVTASIGISTYPECGDDSASLMKTADVAMYRAKEGGRNNYHFYSRTIHAEVSRRARLERDLKDALAGDQFELEFQPVADLRSGRIMGLEALLRWMHPEHGWVRPLEFVPILEATGMMSRVGEWVLASACSEVGEWQRMLNRPDLTISVNMSAQELMHRRIVDVVRRVLTNANIDPSLLIIEITEAELLAQPRATREQLGRLTRLGCRVALDDFGTGYASLQAIRQLPLTFLKIDRSLVMSVPTDPEDVAVIDAGIRFAEDLGLQVVAEGLEVEEQLRFLAGRGCVYGQGHLISAPLPAASVGGFLGRDWRAA